MNDPFAQDITNEIHKAAKIATPYLIEGKICSICGSEVSVEFDEDWDEDGFAMTCGLAGQADDELEPGDAEFEYKHIQDIIREYEAEHSYEGAEVCGVRCPEFVPRPVRCRCCGAEVLPVEALWFDDDQGEFEEPTCSKKCLEIETERVRCELRALEEEARNFWSPEYAEYAEGYDDIPF